MNDLEFDIVTRELVMVKGDFATTTNPSVQNGGSILYSRGANPLAPMIGIGLIPEVIEGTPKVLTYELNRWQSMAYADGATLAQWTAIPSPRNSDVLTDISYL